MNTQLSLALSVATGIFVALSGCGPGDSESYGKSRGGMNSSGNDTPETHLTAVKNHSGFNALIRTPVCEAGTKEVSADVFEGTFLRREKNEDGSIFECRERVRVFVDNRTSLFRVIEQCNDQSGNAGTLFTKTRSTSRYTIAGNRLEITDFGTIEMDSNGTSMTLTHPLAETPISLRLNEKAKLNTDTNHDLYTYLCSVKD